MSAAGSLPVHALTSGDLTLNLKVLPSPLELAMCLDSDSAVDSQALAKGVAYFANPDIHVLSSHVKIIPERSLLNFVQRFEYLICYRMKRSQAVFQTDYIVGGIGSMFRRSAFRKIGYYDTNTVTEDIDASMKMIEVFGNSKQSCAYAADMITHTEACPNIRSLMRQRYRWKWGRSQAFVKHRSIFFNGDDRYTRFFTSFFLPMEIVFDVLFLIEPLVVGFIAYVIITNGSPILLASALATVSLYMIVNALREPYYAGRD